MSAKFTVEQQEANSALREQYLRFLTTLYGKRAKIRMYDNTNVTCVIKAFDVDFENVIVENLETPYPKKYGKAILRTNDIISVSCDE